MRILEVLRAKGRELLVRARDIEHGDDIVLRIFATGDALVPDAPDAPDALETFEREVAIAARLEHPNIVSVGSLQRREGLVYCVMRIGATSTLESRLQESEPLPFIQSLKILRDVASALDYAHDLEVVHGALVPALISLASHGGAQVAGFGEGCAFRLSRRSESPAYKAPEQWQEQAVVDRRADLYALGVIGYELISGRRRATSSSVPGVITVDPLPLTHDVPLRPGLGLNVNAAIIRATAKQPASRFATASAFVDMLEARHLKPVSSLPTQRPKLDVPRTRHFAQLPIAIVAVAGIVLGILATPTVRRVLHTSGSSSAIIAGLDVRASSTSTSSVSRSSGSGSAVGSTERRAPSSGASSSQSIFPGAASDAGGATVRGRTAPAGLTAAPSPSSASASQVPAVGRAGASRSDRAVSQAPDSDPLGTGVVRVEFNGVSSIVIIDGVPRGRTPFLGALPAGAHSVRLTGTQSVEPPRLEIHIANGDTTLASFSVNSPPPR